jgi:hypothetical protein
MIQMKEVDCYIDLAVAVRLQVWNMVLFDEKEPNPVFLLHLGYNGKS